MRLRLAFSVVIACVLFSPERRDVTWSFSALSKQDQTLYWSWRGPIPFGSYGRGIKNHRRHKPNLQDFHVCLISAHPDPSFILIGAFTLWADGSFQKACAFSPIETCSPILWKNNREQSLKMNNNNYNHFSSKYWLAWVGFFLVYMTRERGWK